MAAQSQGASAPAVFDFQSHQIRIVMKNDEPWFVCTDVAETLGYATAKDAARNLDEDEKGRHIVPTLGGNQDLTIINESGLYALVLRSRKPEARKFAKWVTSEVLPSIRKTGGYGGQDPERLKLAFALASEVADQAARTVFDSVLAGDEGWRQGRWLFSLRYGRDEQAVPWAKAVGEDALVASLAELPRMLLEPGALLPSNRELAELAAACNQRLAQRMANEAAKPVGSGVVKI